MSKSDDKGDESSKMTVRSINEVVASENVVEADATAVCSSTKDADQVEVPPKSDDTTSNVANEASATSSQVLGAKRNINDEDKKCELLQKASEKLHCPFYWKADIPINSYGNHEIDLLSDAEEMFEQMNFQFRKFIVHLVMCYHTFYGTSKSKTVEILRRMEGMLVRSARKESSDFLFNTVRDALYHVSHSCHVFVYEQSNQIEKAYKTLAKIKSYESMNGANKAAIWAIRAGVYAEYGYEGVEAAVEYMEKAIKLDDKNAFWLFYRGVYLGRLRRMQKGLKGPKVPTEVEVQCLEKAVLLRPDPAFLAFNGEMWLEVVKSFTMSDFPPKYQEVLSEKLARLSAKAARCFEECVNAKDNCAHLLFRCAKGFMRLPPPYQNLQKAKSLLRKGLEISPKSSYGNHAMAMFKMEYENDSEAAEHHLQKCKDRGNFPAHMDFCRLHYLEGKSADFLIPEFKTMLETYGEIPKQCKIFGELICCYLFLEYNLQEACKCAERLLELQTEWINYIYEFKSFLFPFSQPVALVDLLAAECGLSRTRKDVAEASRNVYSTFLNLLVQKKVRLHDVSKNILQKYKDDLERGLLRKRQRLAETKSRLKEEKQNGHVRRKVGDIRDVPLRFPSPEKEKPKHLRTRSERDASANRQQGATPLTKSRLSSLTLSTRRISRAERLDVFFSNSGRKDDEIRYSGSKKSKKSLSPSLDGKVLRSRHSRKNSRASSVDRKLVRSNRGEQADQRDSSSSPDRGSRPRRTKKSHHRHSSSSLDRESRSSRRKENRRRSSSGSDGHSRSDRRKRDHRRSSSSPDRQSRSSRREKDRRSPNAEPNSEKSHRGAKNGESHDSPPRSSRKKKDDDGRESVTSDRSCREDGAQSRSSRKENDLSPSADTKSVRSKPSNGKDLSDSAVGLEEDSTPSHRELNTDRSPRSVASSRQSRRKERANRSRSCSASRSRPRSLKRKLRRSVSCESKSSRRSRRRSSGSDETGHERGRRRRRSRSSAESRQSGAGRDSETGRSRPRNGRRVGTESDSSGASSEHCSCRTYKSDRRSGSHERDGRRRRRRRDRSSGSSDERRSRRSCRSSRRSEARRSPDERSDNSRRRSRRERSAERSGSESTDSGATLHSRVSRRDVGGEDVVE